METNNGRTVAWLSWLLSGQDRLATLVDAVLNQFRAVKASEALGPERPDRSSGRRRPRRGGRCNAPPDRDCRRRFVASAAVLANPFRRMLAPPPA